MTVTILTGDARSVLAALPTRSIQCCVTSPPYYGLRDYGTSTWDGGNNSACDHAVSVWDGAKQTQGSPSGHAAKADRIDRQECAKCGARRIDRQIGLEKTPDEYVAELVAVFREVRRVLRDNGVMWLNIGDSYCSTAPGTLGDKLNQRGILAGVSDRRAEASRKRRPETPVGMKPKDLIGIPWMLAFALRADGWYLRSEVIWAKPNPMPESVTDRPTKAHEQVFLLSKSSRYFYDAEAIAETAKYPVGDDRKPSGVYAEGSGRFDGGVHRSGGLVTGETRNARSVWSITTKPFRGAHFATMPPDLAEKCIMAGSSEKGCCPHCGAPWVRLVENTALATKRAASDVYAGAAYGSPQSAPRGPKSNFGVRSTNTVGWSPSCDCPPHDPIPCTILDPFGGAGTTGLVAGRLGRNVVLAELNPAYAEITKARLTKGGVACAGDGVAAAMRRNADARAALHAALRAA